MEIEKVLLRDFVRMCSSFDDCDKCPLAISGGQKRCPICSRWGDLKWEEKAEPTIAAWVKNHPEK